MNCPILKKISTNFIFDCYLLTVRNIPFFSRCAYVWRKYVAIILNKRKIKYFEKDFQYDSRFSPAVLETYPRDIADIDNLIDLSRIQSVMDVGANIGQFSFTLKILFPTIQVYSFEPNKEIYSILTRNLSYFQNIRTFNLALGDYTGEADFYISPISSGDGSLYKESYFVRKNIRPIKVDIVELTPNTIRELGIPATFDLIKIDVEGAEMAVLRSLQWIHFDYLYVEVGMKKDTGEGNLETIREFLKTEKQVEPKLLYFDRPYKDSPYANALFSLREDTYQ